MKKKMIGMICLSALAGCQTNAWVTDIGDLPYDKQAQVMSKLENKCVKYNLNPGTKEFKACVDQEKRYENSNRRALREYYGSRSSCTSTFIGSTLTTNCW